MQSNYSLLERLFAGFLSRLPFIKKMIKIIYARIMYLIYNKHKRLICEFDVVDVFKKEGETLFGYYDKSPDSNMGQCLVHFTKNNTAKKPEVNSSILIEVVDGANISDVSVSSSAYNWQQGARAQWLDEDVFLYNDYDAENQKYVAKAFSVKDRSVVRNFDHPVQDSFRDEYFLSLNYQRIMALRPDYGYRCLPALNKTELSNTKNDGIWYVDYNTGESKLLYSIEEICQINYQSIFAKSLHKINHVMISPNGSKCIFIHRYYLGKRRFDRLMLASIHESRLKILAENEMVSHCFWIDDKTVLGYLRGPEKKDAYWMINIESNKFSRLPNNALDGYGDGHPHVHDDWFVTDTYPDKARMQHLLLCNWKTGEVKELGQFFHGFKYSGETRCDLHPRFSADGKSVFFDSVFSGKRRLYSVHLDINPDGMISFFSNETPLGVS